MLYSKKELMVFSLIYSSIEKGRFPKQEIEMDSLYKIFIKSNEENENIFKLEKNEKLKFISDSMKSLKLENSRLKIEKRESKLIDLFTSEERMEKFKIQADLEIKLCEKKNIQHIDYYSEKYPNNLKNISNPPFNLFFKGKIPNDKQLNKSLAIIGSRHPEEKYGKKVAIGLGNKLAKNGWTNISGLALGCDEYGHMGSLEGNGITGAILAHGLDTDIYPKENKGLAEEILDNDGFLMSEIPPSIKLNPLFLVLRDRLQSGMTRGIFVVETSCKSGTLHTVKYSLEQDRSTFIWNPINFKDIDEKSVEGNRVLINRETKKMNVTISKKLKEKIIGIKNFEELKLKLDDLEKPIKKKEIQKQQSLI